MPKQQPIASPEAEQSVLGAILVAPDKLHEIIELIRPEDFYREAHGRIFQAMLDLSETDTPIDYVSVSQHLRDKTQLEAVGGNSFLVSLSEQVGLSDNIKHYAQIIHDKSTLRRLYDAALNIQKDCVNSTGLETQEVLERAQERLSEIIGGTKGRGKKNIAQMVREFLQPQVGNILTTELHKELNLTTLNHKKAANMEMIRLVEEGKLTPCGDKRGCYRIVKESEEIDWLTADIDNIYKIKWPFELEKLVTIYPGNIIVVAGEKGAGKSAFMYNLIKLNQDTHKIIYFNSESGKEEMKLRLSKFEDVPLDSWKFRSYARSSNFPEAIHPDRLNIIDYYEMTDNFYQIGGEIRQIHERLKKGICVIALQKKRGAEYGRGGDFSREKARLYLTMEQGKLKIVDGKIWASDVNPNGIEFFFKLLHGSRFLLWE